MTRRYGLHFASRSDRVLGLNFTGRTSAERRMSSREKTGAERFPMGGWQFVLNIGTALVLGILIGLERQWRQHPAGLRTNALVSLGAAMFVSMSQLMNDTNSPTRIVSYVV